MTIDDENDDVRQRILYLINSPDMDIRYVETALLKEAVIKIDVLEQRLNSERTSHGRTRRMLSDAREENRDLSRRLGKEEA